MLLAEFLSAKAFVAMYTMCNAASLALPSGLLAYSEEMG